MIEPTESEDKAELDRFCEAMIHIRKEIAQIESGQLSKEDNPLKNAPHTASVVTADKWEHPYPRSQAAYPQARLKQNNPNPNPNSDPHPNSNPHPHPHPNPDPNPNPNPNRRPASSRTSSGRPPRASTTPTATATSCARARPSRPSWRWRRRPTSARPASARPASGRHAWGRSARLLARLVGRPAIWCAALVRERTVVA